MPDTPSHPELPVFLVAYGGKWLIDDFTDAAFALDGIL